MLLITADQQSIHLKKVKDTANVSVLLSLKLHLIRKAQNMLRENFSLSPFAFKARHDPFGVTSFAKMYCLW